MNATSGTIGSFFSKLPKDSPRMPIRWTRAAMDPRQKPKRGPDQSTKVRELEVIEIDPDSESESGNRMPLSGDSR